ncbi:type II secretion system protein GspL [Thalassotalea euphylliae]|uniref:Type II secretion system protein L n=1 Tax=Thalassotalea euphylliae TaxID=1655234 RepID=A0A3E0TVI4_9GAMM|nr:type II secretion system protein GspL [Thalassotalea euphylliae]REL28460.1 type II secretion system protein GspL [Thalassotalea euphylliae]
MSETLYIRLASKPEQAISWLVWSTNQQEIIASGEVPDAQALTSISDKARQRQVVAIAPGSDVLLKALTVPAKSTKAMRQAVPYMLEDELAQDVDELFFAFADKVHSDSEHNCHVAIIERQLMHAWLTQLNSAGIKCRVMIPETLLMPLEGDKWSVIAHHGQLVIRQGVWQGATLDERQWQFMAQHWQQMDPVPSFVHYSPIPALPVTIECQEAPAELPLALFAAQSQRDINLLQGEFAVKTERSPAVKYWAMAASLAVVALLLQLGVKGSQWYQLNQTTAQLEQEIIDTYKQAFPNTKRVRIATIKSQLRRKVAEVSGGGAEASFLPMLAKLESAFKQVPELQTSALRYDGKRNELRLQAEASTYQAFDKFKNALEKSRLAVTQGAQNNQGNRVTGSFSIKES